MSMCGMLVGVLIAILIFDLFNFTALLPFISLFVSNLLYNQCNFMARGMRKLGEYTIANIIYLVVMAISVTGLVFFAKMGLNGILYGNAIGHICGAVYVFFHCKIWKSLGAMRFSFSVCKDMVKYSAPLIPNSVSWWIVNVSDRSIVNVFLGAAFNGVYAIAYKLPSLCSTVFGVFHMSWQESAVDSMSDTDRNKYFNGVFNRLVPFCVSVAAGVVAVNRYFYMWIWDEKYISGYYHVWILAVAVCFSFIAQFIGGILVAQKKTKENGLTTVIAAVINIGIHLGLVKFIGLYAASISTLVSYLSLFVIRFAITRKEFELTVYKKSVLSITALVVVIVTQYFDNQIIGALTLVFAVVSTVYFNSDMIKGIAMKALRRI